MMSWRARWVAGRKAAAAGDGTTVLSCKDWFVMGSSSGWGAACATATAEDGWHGDHEQFGAVLTPANNRLLQICLKTAFASERVACVHAGFDLLEITHARV